MNDSHQERSRLIVTGVVANFLGQGWLLLIAFVATPYIVRKLEADLYGVYSLSGIVLSYFAFVDFGLSAAATKYIAQYLAEGNEEGIVTSFWACLVWLIAGGVGCVVLVGLFAEPLVSYALSIPPRLQSVTTATLRIGSITFCCSLCVGLTTGTLRSLGRFTVLNLTLLLVGTAQTIVTVLLLWAGHSLLEVMVAMLVCQIGLFLWHLAACMHALPALRRLRIDRGAIIRLFRFGGILTLGSITGPVLTNIEKLLMTRYSSVGLLTFYAVPFSLVDRLGMIPTAFGAVLFPSFSYFHSLDREANRTLHFRGTLYIAVVYGFFASFFVFLGTPFLRAWMGETFAAQAAGVLGILAVGGLFNAIGRPAITALQGIGKPHIPVLLHATELVWYLPVVYILVTHGGMTGAAWAWCLRAVVDTCSLHLASGLALAERPAAYVKLVKVAAGPMIACSAVFAVVWAWDVPLQTLAAVSTIILTSAAYAALLWTVVIDARTKDTLVSLWRCR